jgi:hypothetical protein
MAAIGNDAETRSRTVEATVFGLFAAALILFRPLDRLLGPDIATVIGFGYLILYVVFVARTRLEPR